MAQFKNSFVAATPSSQQSQAYPNKRPALTGFVSGGTIGGDMGRTQTQTPPVATDQNSSQKNPQSSEDRPRKRKRRSGWDN
ncbi:unnamed protein product [Eruca vesicaria subsp. sativa]|uniref:Uncharacterized protein n=1 Tax=Eruca vesicaria subsp. sativa TaxID=29727 RepID=A0ABC8JLM8_ERUVS|nr:unnamed protein product [Eruca vesicaria subsp. sativa]